MKLVISRIEAELILVSLSTTLSELGSIDPDMSERLRRLHEYVHEEYTK